MYARDPHFAAPGEGRRHRWIARTLIGLVIALLLYAALGFLLVPWIAKGQAEKILAGQFDRPVSIQSIRFNPFKLKLKLRHLDVGAREGDGNNGQSLLKVGALDVDAAWRSLFQLAPVVSAVRLDEPQISVARLTDGKYSIQDLIDKWSAPSDKESDGGIPGFAVSNIELTRGRVDFDDQAKQIRHELADLTVRVPFISSLEVYEEVKVEPHLAATLNGSRFVASGVTEPFSDDRASSIDFRIDGIELPELAAYVPVPLPLKIDSGRLDVDVKVQFEQPPAARPKINVSGKVGLLDIALNELGGEPLLKLGSLVADGLDLKVQENAYRVGGVTIDGLQATVHRREGQKQFFQSVFDALPAAPEATASRAKATAKASTKASASTNVSASADAKAASSAAPGDASAATASNAAPAAAPASTTERPLRWQVDRVALNGATVDFADQQFSPQPLKATLTPIDAVVTGLNSDQGSQFDYRLATRTRLDESISAEGNASLAPVAARGKFDVDKVALKNWWWVVGDQVAAQATDGEVGVSGRYDLALPDAGLQLKLDDLALKLSRLNVVARGQAAPAPAAVKPEPAASSKATSTARSAAAGKAPASSRTASKAASRTGKAVAAAKKPAAAATTSPATLLSVPQLNVSGTSVDVGAQRVVVGAVESQGGRIVLRRDADGLFNVQKLVASSPAPAAGSGETPKRADAAKGAPAPAWTVALDRLQFDGYAVDVSDAKAGKAADLKIDQLAIGLQELTVLGAQPKDRHGKMSLKARVNQRGSVSVAGPLSLTPVSARLAVDARQLSLLPAQPYVAEYLNAVVSNGRVTARGDLSIELPDGKPMVAHWKGDASVDDLTTLSKQSNRDLLRWKGLAVRGMDINVEPLRVRIGDITLSQLYARVILSAQGRLNLQDLLVKEGQPAQADPTAEPGEGAGTTNKGAAVAMPSASSGTPASPASAGQAANASTASASTSGAPAPTSPERKTEVLGEVDRLPAFGSGDGKAERKLPPPPDKPPPDVQIGKITLVDANIDFSDFFVRPNYSANLTGLNGGITKLSPEAPGDVSLKGRIDNAGAVDVTGRLNPFSSALTMDIAAQARDIDLPRLSPYSVKYIGHGIERGKLSATLSYRIVDRLLTAENKVVLDQLTLGERVAGSQAPNLPVQFALSLLKDRNGVIDVELPISGSIDDPQFSIGGIVMRLIGNLIVKAVTSPFSLIGGLFSGAGPDAADLAKIPFAPGSATLEPAANERLGKLAKVLEERPGLKLDIAGIASAERDTDALQRLRLQRRVKALKARETVAEGNELAHLDKLELAPGEYERLLKQLYRDATFEKPRNVLGLTRDVPVAEMEQRLIEHSRLGERQFQELADRRAQAVKDWLAQSAQIGSDRLYIVSSRVEMKPTGAGGTAQPAQSESAPAVVQGDAAGAAVGEPAGAQPAGQRPADGASGTAAGQSPPEAGIGVQLNLRG